MTAVTLAEVADWFRDAERVTVLTGAGVSTDSPPRPQTSFTRL